MGEERSDADKSQSIDADRDADGVEHHRCGSNIPRGSNATRRNHH
jgi:hypothetical protein